MKHTINFDSLLLLKQFPTDIHCNAGDAGPIQPGVGKRFRHPWRQFYHKYRTFSTDFYKCRTSSTEIEYLKTVTTRAWPYALRFTFQCSTTAPHFLLMWSFSSRQKNKSGVGSKFHIKISLWNLNSNENSNKIRQKGHFNQIPKIVFSDEDMRVAG